MTVSILKEAFLKELNKRLSPNKVTGVRPLPKADPVLDSIETFILRTARGQLILSISSEAAPLILKRSIDARRQISSRLRGNAVEHIDTPLIEDFFEGRSYVVWFWRKPLSTNRILSRIEKKLIAPGVYRWLRDVASQTVTPADPFKLAENLEELQTDSALPLHIRTAAEVARHAFLSGKIPAVNVIQHGDLWIGNIVKAPSKTGFFIIDWSGAKIDGLPFYDLVKFHVSVSTSKSILQKEIYAHSVILGCDSNNALAYVLSGLGRLHSELEHFPMNSFVELCKKKFDALAAVTAD